MSVLSAGIIFFMCGFSPSVPKNVTINGQNVGGMSYSAAASAVRAPIEEELKSKTLHIIGENSEYRFSYPEINYKDNIFKLIRSAVRGGNYVADVNYYLCGMDYVIAAICDNERVKKTEPYAEFRTSGEPFIYRAGTDGRQADGERLKADIVSALNGGSGRVNVHYSVEPRGKSLADVRNATRLLGEFTTYFDGSNLNRASNIKLAAALLNGVIVDGGKSFSFNNAVGARSPERGFKSAKIIENGEYTEGIGGGVCQVSTTLYNAALLSGLTVTEFHPHSLAVGYVAPSRDAMVSGSACDLKFSNPSETPVYIRAFTGDNSVTFRIYGKSDGAIYSLESVVTGSVPAGEELCSDPALAREGREGVESEGYLLVSRGGNVTRVKLRADTYRPLKKIVYDGAGEEDATQNLVNF